jgi:hypothetical protein
MSRLDFHTLLAQVTKSEIPIYYQPPETINMEYPCIVYVRDDIQSDYSNNSRYRNKVRYELTVIDKDPDSPYLEPILSIPYTSYQRHFTSDNLNHDVFEVYY